MNWTSAISYNQKALTRIVAEIFALIGLVSGTILENLPQQLYLKANRILRPTESAVRRLIVLAMQGMVVKPSVSRKLPFGKVIPKKPADASRRMAFQLIDPRKRFDGLTFAEKAPKHYEWKLVKTYSSLPTYPRSLDDRFVTWRKAVKLPFKHNTAHFCRRLEAVKYALENIDKQARRLARLLAKPTSKSPMRPGLAPGYSENAKTEINELLRDLQFHALGALRTDTS